MDTTDMISEIAVGYLPIVVFIVIALGFSGVILGISYLRAQRRPDKNKLAPYECGFETLSSSRIKIDVRFYLVAILFIIFDLEVAFLFPWAVTLGSIGVVGFWSMMFFLFGRKFY